MACMVMAYVVMTYGLSEFGLSFFYILYRDVLYGHGTCSYGLCAGVADAGHACPMPSSRSYCAYSSGLYSLCSYGRSSYGLRAGVADAGHVRCGAVGVMAHVFVACIVMAYAVMAHVVMACTQGSPTLAMSDAEQSEFGLLCEFIVERWYMLIMTK